jgi:hypothetical protein
VVAHRREIPDVVARLAESPQELRLLRANLEALPENQAVYEVIELITAALGGG